MPEVIARAPGGWKNKHLDYVDTEVEVEREDRDISPERLAERSGAQARSPGRVHAAVCGSAPNRTLPERFPAALGEEPGQFRSKPTTGKVDAQLSLLPPDKKRQAYLAH